MLWISKEGFRVCFLNDPVDPDMVILVDYPGFNLRLAEAIKRRGIKTKVVYYISPQADSISSVISMAISSAAVASCPDTAGRRPDHILDSGPIDPEFDLRGNI